MTLKTLNSCIATDNSMSSSTGLSVYTIVIISVASGLVFLCCLMGFLRNRGRCNCRCCDRVEEDARSETEYVEQVLKWRSEGEAVDSLNQIPSSKDLR